MTSYTWRTGGGALDQANNWSPATVPTSGDIALFNAGGGTLTPGTLTGNLTVGTLDVVAAGWALSSQIFAGALMLDNSGFAVGGTSAQLEIGQSFAVGLVGSAALSASDGGVIADTAAPTGATAQFGTASLTLSSHSIAMFSCNLSLGVNGKATTASIDAALLTVGGALLVGAGGSPASGSATVTVQDGGQLVMSGAGNSANTSATLQLGTQAATAGTINVTGANSLLLSTNNSTTVGVNGSGTLAVSGGGSARFGTANYGLAPALTIASAAGSSGNVSVSGAGSLLAAAGSLLVGSRGTATLSVSGGASVSASAPAAGSALSVAGPAGVVTVDGGGTSLLAAGSAVIGGDNRGSGLHAGGAGTVSLSNGGSFQVSSGLTVFAGSRVNVDGASTLSVGGDLTLGGTIASYGTIAIGGTVSGGGTLQIGAGLGSLGAINGVSIGFGGSATTLLVRSVAGSNTISGMQYGDAIDLVGITGATIGSNEVFLQNGATIVLTGAPTNTQYALTSDGNGGTELSLMPSTASVYRFFDSAYGTHFFSSSATEKNDIIATRPDLIYEGVGLQSVDPASGDPNAASVYRFFDSTYGTHFFTASATERDAVIQTRADLVYEGNGFDEHTAQQPGDVPVFRFFDTHYGTHFYTADAGERAMIVATRSDLIDEGVGFYAPA